ncbi:MAG TPA: hypothetical protein VJ715_04480, partial [Pyrinomonadaceae bacterium]|nr:hypothetical protein [Pyrinomonadaceae bacterium]
MPSPSSSRNAFPRPPKHAANSGARGQKSGRKRRTPLDRPFRHQTLRRALVFNAAHSNLVFVTDVDAGAAAVRVALTAQKGTTTLSTTAGLTFSTGDGTNDQYLIFTGTLSNVNAAMNGMQFKPTTNYTGAASLKIIS